MKRYIGQKFVSKERADHLEFEATATNIKYAKDPLRYTGYDCEMPDTLSTELPHVPFLKEK